MAQRLADLDMGPKELAGLTGDEERQVQRWLKIGDSKVPADFVARYIQHVPVNPRWLLTEYGEPEREPLRPGEVELLLREVRDLVKRATDAPTSPAEAPDLSQVEKLPNQGQTTDGQDEREAG